MKYITDADPYLNGDSKNFKNWQSIYKEPKTCYTCENKHGKIYSYTSLFKRWPNLYQLRSCTNIL